MNPYFELFLELGIQMDADTIDAFTPAPPPPTPPPIPITSTPQYDDKGRKFYTVQQIDIFGEPDDDMYYVLLEEEDAHPLTLNYDDEIQLIKPRPTHKYCRKIRFRFCLTYLLGQSGKIPASVLKIIADAFGVESIIKHRWYKWNHNMYQVQEFTATSQLIWDPATIWERTRMLLKRKGLTLYYNRIPLILRAFGIIGPKANQKQYTAIMKDFNQLNTFFTTRKGMKYFPHLRYIALRLMDRHGITSPYDIPLLQTSRKLKVLQEKLDFIQNRVKEQGVGQTQSKCNNSA
jgi:Poxvirus Late Transcription Factor VLTF3 like